MLLIGVDCFDFTWSPVDRGLGIEEFEHYTNIIHGQEEEYPKRNHRGSQNWPYAVFLLLHLLLISCVALAVFLLRFSIC